ncbi:MAG: GNAT family N-acetyltransferase [Desulfobacterales bacterium]|nr:GNAT family N-acetyltransferase [Desulfobacterales bacterium]
MEYRIRTLRKNDNRREFQSGQADLDLFLKRFAGQNQFRHHIGVTYIATNEDTLLGYITVAMGSLEADELPNNKKLPAKYPLPILRLGRLAVDARYHGKGIGKQLLGHAFLLALRQRDTVGCIGIVVDAKPEAIKYYQNFGFRLIGEAVEGNIKGNPPPKSMFLPIRSIVDVQ